MDTPATIIYEANYFINNSAQMGSVLYMSNGLANSKFKDSMVTCNTANQGLMFLDHSTLTFRQSNDYK